MSTVRDARSTARSAPEIPAQRRGGTDPQTAATPPAPVADACRCGHGPDAHEHYRPGTDCGACGTGCRAYRRADGDRRRGLRRT